MKKLSILIFSVILLSLFAFPELTEPPETDAKYYENAKVIRVKYTDGEAYVKRSYEDSFEEAAINLPVFEKDTIGTTQGRLELYLGRLNYLRLDYDTEIEFDKVPALRTTGMTFRINKGGVYLDVENLDYEKDIEVQTPDCGVFLLDKGLYRINVNEGGKTEVLVFKGTAEVAGDGYSRNVRANQKIVMLDGRVRERPFYFYSSDQDEFDHWNELRNKEVGYSRYASSQYLDDGYEDYEYELSRNGRWKYSTTYHSYIWMPYHVGSYWSPYYHGRWVWHPFYGYVWHSYDSWGWYCHYYGRWHWSYYDGWCWVPGYRWSPAWVSWGWYGHYYGWCPLSYYNRPLIVINKRWLRNHNYRKGIPMNSRSLVVVKKNQLSSSHIHKVALKKDSLGAKTLTFKGSAPKERPEIAKVTVINAKGNSVVYNRGGIFSTGKYKAVSSTSGKSKTGVKGTVYKYSGSQVGSVNVNKYSTGAKGTVTKAKVYKTATPVTKSESYKTGTSVTKKTYTPGTTVTQKSGSTVTKTKVYKSGDSVTKSKTYKSSGSTSKATVSKKYPTSKSSSSKSSAKVYKKSGSKSKSSVSSKKVKKKKDSPSLSNRSYTSASRSYSNSGPSYAAAPAKKTYRSYSTPKTTYKSSYRSNTTPRKTYKSYYNSSSPRKTYSSSYRARSYSSIKSYKPSSSYKYYSRPSSSSSSYRRSSSYRSSSSRSYSRSSSSRSYSRSSSGRSSSGRSSSSRSSSSRSSSSSSRSVRKK